MQATVHRKIRVLEYAPIAIFRYFLQKTDIVVNSKTKGFDNTTASLRIIISQRNRFFKPKQLLTVFACYDFATPSRQSALIMMSQTLARKAKKEHHRKGGALLFLSYPNNFEPYIMRKKPNSSFFVIISNGTTFCHFYNSPKTNSCTIK